MNKEILVNTVSKLLGVSSSEKEFAFQIFLEKTADVLGKDEAIKYPGLGFFYFKETPEDKDAAVESLLYVPIRDGSEILEENFFLSFDVKRKSRNNSMDFDPSVFSLSIDKATIPFERDKERNTDISYHLLKKTIEERVEELISSASHIENFKILDTLFTENSVKEEFVPAEEKEIFDAPRDSSYEEMIFSRMNFDEAGDIPQFEKSELEDMPETIPLPEAEQSIIGPDIVETVPFKEGSNETPQPDLSDFDFIDMKDKKEDKEDIDWAWAEKGEEESREEEKRAEKEISPAVEEPVKTEVPEIITTASAEPADDPFAELQKTIDQELIINEIPKENKISNETRDEAPAIQKESTIENGEQKMTENKENTPIEENNPYSEDDSNQKRNIILICAMVIIVLVAVYIIFFNGFGLIKKSAATPQQAKTEQPQNQPGETKDSLAAAADNTQKASGFQPATKEAVKSDVKTPAKADEKYQKLKESSESTLLREMKNDNKVGSNIFTDGTKFYVQVSSWKNIAKAEQEAKKLKAKGQDAFIVKAYIEQFKGTWYRVRVGSFKTKAEAEAFSSKNR
jgi:cell division protein FtsN/nucleoid DNA-binding protein